VTFACDERERLRGLDWQVCLRWPRRLLWQAGLTARHTQKCAASVDVLHLKDLDSSVIYDFDTWIRKHPAWADPNGPEPASVSFRVSDRLGPNRVLG
jgi:hypothetical protein